MSPRAPRSAPRTASASAPTAAPADLQPWQWPEHHWRGLVAQVRAGRALRPAAWKDGARCAVALSFDSDHETNELRDGGRSIGRMAWGEYGARRGVPRILELLRSHDVRATFFVLGWVAERHPELVGRIIAAGHEVGCHSHRHPMLHRLNAQEFADDLDRALATLRAAGAVAVAGYRAPSFTLLPAVSGYLEILRGRGLRYDSSIFPIRHPRYGQPHAPRTPFRLRGTPDFVEVPMTVARVGGVNVPFSGGGYLRLLPMPAYRLLRDTARRQGVPCLIYLHPWELDDWRPEVGLDPVTRLRSQGGQQSVPRKLAAALAAGNFRTLGAYVADRLAAGDLPELSPPFRASPPAPARAVA